MKHNPKAAPKTHSENGNFVASRVMKRRQATRARLLAAAYEVMAEVGVDAAKIKDITDRADVGFGTFYNYFATKDMLAREVLDCAIHDFGRRCDFATQELQLKDIALVMPVSMRLVMQDVMRARMWRWWALRPDLLVDRMRDGFKPFAVRDIRAAVAAGIFHVDVDKIESIWSLAVWMMVGGIHDVVVGERGPESAIQVVDSVMRMMGVSVREAARISSSPLPKYPPPRIDWNYTLSSGVEEQTKMWQADIADSAGNRERRMPNRRGEQGSKKGQKTSPSRLRSRISSEPTF